MTVGAGGLFLFTIGEVARRTGVRPTTLRAWERRYGVPRPTRTDGRYRLYDQQALSEIASLVRHRTTGIRPKQASLLITHPHVAADRDGDVRFKSWRLRLERACLRFDEPATTAVIDDAAREVGLLVVLKQVVLPIVAQLGDAWHAGLVNISHEHFVSQVAHHVAMSLCRAMPTDRGRRPTLVTGCAPNERHELGLLLLVAELRSLGHRVVHLGSDVPVGAFLEALDAIQVPVAVVSATMGGRLRAWQDQRAQVRRRERRGVTFVWAGPGAERDGQKLPGVTMASMTEAITGLDLLLSRRRMPNTRTLVPSHSSKRRRRKA